MSDTPDRFDVLAELGALRRYAGSLARGGEEAEDLVHDTLVRAYERRATFRYDRNLRVWLLSILHNCFVDRLRRRRGEASGSDRAGEVAETAVPASQEHSVRLAEVREAFLALPAEQRAVLHLVAIEGLSYAEAAASLGVPVGTVMSRLARARATLRALEDGTPRAGPAPRLRIVGGSDEPH
jgi:RNA polymerase sigma factor (sigma-70 family)